MADGTCQRSDIEVSSCQPRVPICGELEAGAPPPWGGLGHTGPMLGSSSGPTLWVLSEVFQVPQQVCPLLHLQWG